MQTKNWKFARVLAMAALMVMAAGAAPRAVAQQMEAQDFSALKSKKAKAPKPLKVSGRIAFSSNVTGNDEIYLANADGSNASQLTKDVPSPYTPADVQPAFSPKGDKIAWVSVGRAGATDIWIMDSNGGNQKRLTYAANADVVNSNPVFSPDGKQIAFTSNCGCGTQIFLLNIDGSGLVAVTNVGANLDQQAFHPAFSADGKQIAFASTPDDNRLYGTFLAVVNVDGSGRRLLLDASGNIIPGDNPSFSPNGQTLVFNTQSGQTNASIVVLDKRGNIFYPFVTSRGTYATQPVYSPDGKNIAFALGGFNSQDIVAISADGTKTRSLIATAGNETHPSWSK